MRWGGCLAGYITDERRCSLTCRFGVRDGRYGQVMRLGVLDIGSNTVHMLVVDAYPGARPLPAFSHKVDLSLAAHLEHGNTLSKVGEKRRVRSPNSPVARISASNKGWDSFGA